MNKVAGGVTTYTYDRRGLLLTETLPAPSADQDGNVLAYYTTNSYAYDARGNRIQMVEAVGLPEARTTTYVYDRANRLIEKILPAVDVFLAGPDFSGQVTPREYYTYDARGNVTSHIDAGGAKTVYFYDDLGRVVVTINAAGTRSDNVYDENGNVTSTRIYGTTVTVPTEGGSEEEKPTAPGGLYRETTFTYDNLGRLLTSGIAGVTSYIFDGSSYVLQATTLTTTFEYSANGDVVQSFDANGKATFHYYDRLGRKTAQLDVGGYLTDWAYDAEGNVVSERRYAARFAGAPTTISPPVLAHDAADRVTQYGYDRNGNRTIEQRLNVVVHNGSGGTSTVHSTLYYQYNGLGQVVRKYEAAGEDIQYLYDNAGRLGREIRSAFTSHQGASVTPTIDYFYNGLGNLTRTAGAGAGDAASRVTRYDYGLGGRLAVQYGADGTNRFYSYDAAGRQTREQVAGYTSDGTLNYKNFFTDYDVIGRATRSTSGTHYATTGWHWDVNHFTNYDAYGEAVTTSLYGLLPV